MLIESFHKKILFLLILLAMVMLLFGCTSNEKSSITPPSVLNIEACKYDNYSTSYICLEQDKCILSVAKYNNDLSNCDYVTNNDLRNLCLDESTDISTKYSIKVNEENIYEFNKSNEKYEILINQTATNKLKEEYITYNKAYFDQKKEELIDLINSKKSQYSLEIEGLESLNDVLGYYYTGGQLNSNNCEKIKSENAKEWCLLLTKQNVTESFCDSLTNLSGDCYFILAINNKDNLYCEKAENSSLFGFVDCESAIISKRAIDSKSASICREINYGSSNFVSNVKEYSEFASCVLQVVYADKSPTQCNVLEDDSKRTGILVPLKSFFKEGCQKMDWTSDFVPAEYNLSFNQDSLCNNSNCYSRKAIENKDPSYCEQITNIYDKEACYNVGYLVTQDKKFVKTKESAINHFLLNKEILCDNVNEKRNPGEEFSFLNENQKIMCYTEIGKLSNDEKICEKAIDIYSNYSSNEKEDMYNEAESIKNCFLITTIVPENKLEKCIEISEKLDYLFLGFEKNDCYKSYSLIKNDLLGCMALYQWNPVVLKEKTTAELNEQNKSAKEELEKTNTVVNTACENEHYKTVKSTYGISFTTESYRKFTEKAKNSGNEVLNTLDGLDCLEYIELGYLSKDYFLSISDISSLTKLKNLKGVDISGTSVNNISPLLELQNIEILGLPENKITNFSTLDNFNNLKELRIGEQELTNISNISVFNFEKVVIRPTDYMNKIKINQEIINAFSENKKMKKLDIEYVNFEENIDITPLKELIELRIGIKNKSTALQLKAFEKIETLSLYLDEYTYPEADQALKEVNGSFLKWLNLTISPSYDSKFQLNVEDLYKLNKLETLYLTKVKMGNKIDLKNFPNIKNFYLSDAYNIGSIDDILGKESLGYLTINSKKLFIGCTNFKKNNTSIKVNCYDIGD